MIRFARWSMFQLSHGWDLQLNSRASNCKTRWVKLESSPGKVDRKTWHKKMGTHKNRVKKGWKGWKGWKSGWKVGNPFFFGKVGKLLKKNSLQADSEGSINFCWECYLSSVYPQLTVSRPFAGDFWSFWAFWIQDVFFFVGSGNGCIYIDTYIHMWSPWSPHPRKKNTNHHFFKKIMLDGIYSVLCMFGCLEFGANFAGWLYIYIFIQYMYVHSWCVFLTQCVWQGTKKVLIPPWNQEPRLHKKFWGNLGSWYLLSTYLSSWNINGALPVNIEQSLFFWSHSSSNRTRPFQKSS